MNREILSPDPRRREHPPSTGHDVSVDPDRFDDESPSPRGGPCGKRRAGQLAYLGIDAGGSRSRALCLDDSLRPIGVACKGPPVNATRLEPRESARRLAALAREALAPCGRTASPSLIAMAVAGAGRATIRERLERELLPLLPSVGQHVVADVDAVLAAVQPDPDPLGTVVIIAGTGSIAAGQAGKRRARAGGQGLVDGDPGSGAWFGLRALENPALRARLGPVPDPLPPTEAVAAAALFPELVRMAREGDQDAQNLLSEGALRLADQARCVIRELELAERSFPLALWGGVFRAGPLITDPLCDTILGFAPGARIVRPEEPPEVGAVRLALRKERSDRDERRS